MYVLQHRKTGMYRCEQASDTEDLQFARVFLYPAYVYRFLVRNDCFSDYDILEADLVLRKKDPEDPKWQYFDPPTRSPMPTAQR